MLILANILVSGIVYIWLIHFLPEIAGDSWVLYLLNLALGIFLAVHVLGNYLACAFTPPGIPPPCDDPAVYFGKKLSGLVDGKPVYQVRHMLELAPAVNYRWCRHCKCIKPPRTHHCRYVLHRALKCRLCLCRCRYSVMNVTVLLCPLNNMLPLMPLRS
jgi:hypothetical protein